MHSDPTYRTLAQIAEAEFALKLAEVRVAATRAGFQAAMTDVDDLDGSLCCAKENELSRALADLAFSHAVVEAANGCCPLPLVIPWDEFAFDQLKRLAKTMQTETWLVADVYGNVVTGQKVVVRLWNMCFKGSCADVKSEALYRRCIEQPPGGRYLFVKHGSGETVIRVNSDAAAVPAKQG